MSKPKIMIKLDPVVKSGLEFCCTVLGTDMDSFITYLINIHTPRIVKAHQEFRKNVEKICPEITDKAIERMTNDIPIVDGQDTTSVQNGGECGGGCCSKGECGSTCGKD